MGKLKPGEKYVVLTIIIEKTQDAYEAVCEELGTASFGDTLREAQDNINDAIICELNALEGLGIRQRIFKEKGIKIRKYPKTAPLPQPMDKIPKKKLSLEANIQRACFPLKDVA